MHGLNWELIQNSMLVLQEKQAGIFFADSLEAIRAILGDARPHRPHQASRSARMASNQRRVSGLSDSKASIRST